MSAFSAVALPDYCEAAQRFAAVHADACVQRFVPNIEAQVLMLDVGGVTMPVTVHDEAPGNAWVCSPLTTYGRYALEESQRMLPAALAPPVRAVIGGAEGWLRRAGLDRAVSVNNWLLSTNLYPDARYVDAQALVRVCRERWPAHAIWLRSLNTVQHGDWLAVLAKAGFVFIPSRQVYLFGDIGARAMRHANTRHDRKLLRRTPFHPLRHADFDDARFVRAERLYAQLYLEKYSRLNPQYNAAFLQAWHRAGLLEFSGFADAQGELCAVLGLFAQGQVFTAPIVGYDTARPTSAGLYRLLIARALERTEQAGGELNLSAGAGHFKRLRGGEPAIEYSAVYARHLPRATRRALMVLRALTRGVGVPLMRYFKL